MSPYRNFFGKGLDSIWRTPAKFISVQPDRVPTTSREPRQYKMPVLLILCKRAQKGLVLHQGHSNNFHLRRYTAFQWCSYSTAFPSFSPPLPIPCCEISPPPTVSLVSQCTLGTRLRLQKWLQGSRVAAGSDICLQGGSVEGKRATEWCRNWPRLSLTQRWIFLNENPSSPR